MSVCERYCYWLHSVDSEFYLCAVLPEQMCCTISGPPSFPACIAWPTLPLKVNPASMHHLMHAATPLAIYTCQRQSIVNIAIYKHVTDYSVFFSSFFFLHQDITEGEHSCQLHTGHTEQIELS